MAGPRAHYQYISDNGTTYAVSMPIWQSTVSNHAGTIFQASLLSTTQTPLPKGFRRRKRFIVHGSPPREIAVTVTDATSTLWTAQEGASMQIPLFNNSPPTSDNATLGGATGEKRRAT